jgi:hypothetical protein
MLELQPTRIAPPTSTSASMRRLLDHELRSTLFDGDWVIT